MPVVPVRSLLPLLLALSAACGPVQQAPADAGPSDPSCQPPFRSVATGLGCEAVLPPNDCPPGTRAQLGSETCAPVGWTTCPAGFETDPSGWGCREVLPAAPCTGATMEWLGERDCHLVGDCGAPFPPAAATLFVDGRFTSAQLDATHFRTIGSALAAAPAGATIAIEEGQYVEALTPTRPVSLVGRCAQKVSLQSPGANNPGVAVRKAITVGVSGLTLTGHYVGLYVENGGSLTARQCVLEANRVMGVHVVGAGSTASVSETVVRETVNPSGIFGRAANAESGGSMTLTRTALMRNKTIDVCASGAGSSAIITDSVLSGTGPSSSGRSGLGVYAPDGANVTLLRTAVVGNRETGIAAVNGSSVSLTESVVSGTRTLDDGSAGYGLLVQFGTLSLDRVTFADNHAIAVAVRGAGSTGHVVDAVMRGTLPDADGLGKGLEIMDGATADVADVALVHNAGGALFLSQQGKLTAARLLVRDTVSTAAWADARALEVASGSCLDLRDSSLVANEGLGLIVIQDPGAPAACEAHVATTAIGPTLPTAAGLAGVGLVVQGGRLAWDEGAIFQSHLAGAIVSEGQATLRHLRVYDTAREQATELYGYGVFVEPRGSLVLEDGECRGAAAVGLAFSASSGAISGGRVIGNPVALHVQDGSTLSEVDAPLATPGSTEVLVSTTTQFVLNTTRLGAGAVPVPPLHLGQPAP